jgi:hypothetical protein
VKIKMLEDAPGSPDGIHVYDYDAGVEYDVTDSLGNVFVKHGHAELVEGELTPEPVEPKRTPEHSPAPEPASARKPRAKKNAGAQPENKSE